MLTIKFATLNINGLNEHLKQIKLLEYLRQNQKALRADTYKNVQQITQERQRELAPRAEGVYQDDHRQPSIGRKILVSFYQC